MLRLQKYAHTALAFLFVLAGIVVSAQAKCADALIHVYGNVSGQTASGLTISVETYAKARRPAPLAAVFGDGHFDLTANFDTFLFEDNKGEHCFRLPETIILILRRQETQVTRISLDVDKNFIRDRLLNYELRKRIIIQIPQQ